MIAASSTDDIAERLRATPPPAIAALPGAPDPAEPVVAVSRADIDAFYDSRPFLARIRQFARSRMCAPDAVLAVVLARVIAATPHTVCLPPVVGGKASLNMAFGLVGRSGSGKGAAEATARDCFSLGSRVGTFKTHKLGSGQGIAHGYARREKNELVQHNHACLFTMHEVNHLAAQARQQGSTLLAELRSALMGEQLGHLYVDPAKRIEVQPHTYRLALTVGIQPARSGVLLNDSDGGTPQRFVWMLTTDPEAPDEPPDEPPPWIWQVPGDWPTELDVCSAACDAIREARQAENRGEGNPLDGHRLLLREKVAAALDLADGRPEVSEEGWQLSQIVLGMSDAARKVCQDALAEKERERDVAVGLSQGRRQAAADEYVADRIVKRVGSALMRRVGPEWTPRAELRRALASRDRPYFDEAITNLIAAGVVVADDDGPGTRYRRV